MHHIQGVQRYRCSSTSMTLAMARRLQIRKRHSPEADLIASDFAQRLSDQESSLHGNARQESDHAPANSQKM